MRSYPVYTVDTSDDGVIGIYTTKKKAIEAAAEYAENAVVEGYDIDDEAFNDDDGKWLFTTFRYNDMSGHATATKVMVQ